MQTKFLFSLAITFAFGMATTFVLINKYSAFDNPTEDMIQVYVAKENIAAGSKLTPAQFTLVPWPSSKLLDGAIQLAEQFDQYYLKANLYVGELLTDCKISSGRNGGIDCLPRLSPGEIDQLIQCMVNNRKCGPGAAP